MCVRLSSLTFGVLAMKPDMGQVRNIASIAEGIGLFFILLGNVGMADRFQMSNAESSVFFLSSMGEVLAVSQHQLKITL